MKPLRHDKSYVLHNMKFHSHLNQSSKQRLWDIEYQGSQPGNYIQLIDSQWIIYGHYSRVCWVMRHNLFVLISVYGLWISSIYLFIF